MKAIKLLMAVVVIGLVGASCSLGQQCSSCGDKTESGLGNPFFIGPDSGTISPVEEGWPTWDDEFDFGDDLVWENFGTEKYEPPKDASSGEGQSSGSSAGSSAGSSEGSSDDTSDGYTPVDDWIIDEGFYSDYGGSEGEEFGWGETDDHPGMPGPDENALWIVFPYSNNVRTTELLIQKERYAKELIIPGKSGTITIYEDGPNGVKAYVPNWYVKAERAYRVWFTADSAGDYTVWYEVHDEKFNVTNKSNVIEYRVFENLAVVVPNEAKCPNETATLRALASGCENASYQWYRGNSSDTGTPINNATSSSYIIWSVQDGDEGYYTCKVTCNGNSVEDAGWLNVGWWDCEGGISPCKCQFRPK
jgi:hypothetical protein